MSRLPNPFSIGQGGMQQTPQRGSRPQTPGFLLVTRPPTGANSYGGASYQSPLGSSQSFIPFSNVGGSDHNPPDGNRRNNGSRDNSNKFGYGRGGGGRQGNFASPRFAHPYQQSPGGRMPSPRGQEHGFSNSPGIRHNTPGMRYSTPRGNFNNNSPGIRFHSGGHRGRFNDRHERSFGDHNRSNPNGNFRGGRTRGKGPISSIPIDKFISDRMIRDPWAGLLDEPEEDDGQIEESGPPVVTLEDSEIIIDSDTSAVVENSNSFEDVISDTEADSSPVHDTGSDSPNIATSSTSEKDTGSDSGSDTEQL